MPDKVRQQHGNCVSGETGPGTSHITINGNKENVHQNNNRTGRYRKISTPLCFICQFIPEGKIEIDTHKDFGSHHDRHYPQSRPVIRADDIAQNIQIEHDSQECQQCKDDEKLHGLRIYLLIVFVPALSEDKRLVCIAESLCKHRHHHSNFAGSSINAQLHSSFRLIRIDKRKNNLIGHLIQDTRQAKYQ